jgi:prevent-host-death family protein
VKGIMLKIQLKDAKKRLSALVDQAVRGKPFVITRRGRPEAVVLGFGDWERLSRVPSFGRLLMSAPLDPGDVPERNRAPLRNAGL